MCLLSLIGGEAWSPDVNTLTETPQLVSLDALLNLLLMVSSCSVETAGSSKIFVHHLSQHVMLLEVDGRLKSPDGPHSVAQGELRRWLDRELQLELR
ncbi:hypothetical protein DPEC_G00362020 [Dallia pectoralis]|nr:hypothetical protein DPEC_G00362020 [Dallia pectoralis]